MIIIDSPISASSGQLSGSLTFQIYSADTGVQKMPIQEISTSKEMILTFFPFIRHFLFAFFSQYQWITTGVKVVMENQTPLRRVPILIHLSYTFRISGFFHVPGRFRECSLAQRMFIDVMNIQCRRSTGNWPRPSRWCPSPTRRMKP